MPLIQELPAEGEKINVVDDRLDIAIVFDFLFVNFLCICFIFCQN